MTRRAAADIEGHAFDIGGIGLIVIQRAGRGDRMAIGRMGRDVIDLLAVEIDRTAVAHSGDMLGASLDAGNCRARIQMPCSSLFSVTCCRPRAGHHY